MKTTLEFNTHNLPYVLLVVVAGFLILVSRFLEKECAFTARNGIVRLTLQVALRILSLNEGTSFFDEALELAGLFKVGHDRRIIIGGDGGPVGLGEVGGFS